MGYAARLARMNVFLRYAQKSAHPWHQINAPLSQGSFMGYHNYMEPRLIYICEICQTVLEEHHCKAQCPNCGRMFDCSDLPLIPANGAIDDGEYVARPGALPPQSFPETKSGQKQTPGADEAKVADLP